MFFHRNSQRQHLRLSKTLAMRYQANELLIPEYLIYNSDSFSSSHFINTAVGSLTSKESSVHTLVMV